MGTGTQDTGGAGGFQPYQFTPETYGAVGNSSIDGTTGTDDTAAINSCIQAAITWAINTGTNYTEIVFSPYKRYRIHGALKQNTAQASPLSGTTKGNAQIPLPNVNPHNQKLVLVFRGGVDATATPHWNQHVAMSAGAVLVSDVVGTNDGTYGEASIIGGPTPTQGYGAIGGLGSPYDPLFSNVHVVVDGLTVVAPADPHICHIDLRGIAACNVISASAMTTAPLFFPDQSFGSNQMVYPTQNWTFGLAMPQTGNNNNCEIGNYSCQGAYHGLISSEHTSVTTCRLAYCVRGVGHWNNISSHSAIFRHLNIEWCSVGITPIASVPSKLDVICLDWESGISAPWQPLNIIYDPGNALTGRISIRGANLSTMNTGGTTGMVYVGKNLSVECGDMYFGDATADFAALNGLGSSGVATRNPLWRDCMLTLTGGVVTVIAVDGQTLGITSGSFMVPAGRPWTCTYSVAPTVKAVVR